MPKGDRSRARRARQRQFHIGRIQAARGDVEKLEAAFGLLRSDLLNTSDRHAAHRVAEEALTYLLAASERIPRSTT